MKVIVPLAILANLGMAWLFFRDWRDTLIAHVPLVTGMAWLVGLMALLGMSLNVVNIVAAIISTGVIVDYGLGMTYENRQELRLGTPMAVTLSAATNVVGAGALLFTKHPALFSTGVAMVICMTSGYLAAMLVVPPLCRLLGGPKLAEERP
jgi:predicted RND superfamily exporter protein